MDTGLILDTVVPDVTAPVSPGTQQVNQLQQQLEQMAALNELVARVSAANDPKTACQVLTDQLQDYFSADKVLVGLCRERSIECTLLAVSGVETFHPRGELAQSAQAVLQESIARGELTTWPVTDVTKSGGLLSHGQFARTAQVEAIVSPPLRDANGELRGAWLIVGEKHEVHSPPVTNFLQAAESSVATALYTARRNQKGLLQRCLNEIGRLSQEKRGRLVAAVVTLIVLTLCMPVHYRAKCECTIEPGSRRFVAAPFAGPLERAFVEPGDVVDVGQLLARMDGRELRMELAGTRADLHRASKERAGHLATHESGQSEVARYEVDRLQLRTDLLEHRENNVDIHSPIAGVVVSGDLEDAEGMPLEVGQSLFEIAPLDQMVVEISIAEDDFAYVRPGMAVTVRLDAYPLRKFNATIERVHPRSEMRDDANVFIAEVSLEHSVIELRPGMRGTARVQADRYPLGWNLFRRPFTAVVAWLGW